jgi:coenzyme PQQ biosynthesis protein PqqD
MKNHLDLNSAYIPSEDVVARDIHGEFIIIPVASGIGDSDDEIFSLNKSGRVIWDRLSGKRNLKDIIDDLSNEFEAAAEEIEKDVSGFIEELLKRKMVRRA